MSTDEILADYPRLKPIDIQAALHYSFYQLHHQARDYLCSAFESEQWDADSD